MILEATAEFLRREAADDYGDVVIARNVTLAELDEVPPHWLKHARIALRADGTLVITKLHGTAHGNTVVEITTQVASYAGANGMDIGAGLEEFPNLQAAEPDVQLVTQAVNPNDEIIARALFEVEFSHRSCPEIITMVTNYFTQLPALERVVVFKFFPPPDSQANRVQGTYDLAYLRVPAFLIVFRRIANAGPNDVARTFCPRRGSRGASTETDTSPPVHSREPERRAARRSRTHHGIRCDDASASTCHPLGSRSHLLGGDAWLERRSPGRRSSCSSGSSTRGPGYGSGTGRDCGGGSRRRPVTTRSPSSLPAALELISTSGTVDVHFSPNTFS